MNLWIGNLGQTQRGEPFVHILIYSAVRWAYLECSKQLHSHVRSLGSARTVGQRAYLWSLPNGNLRAERLLSWQLRVPREGPPRDRKWKLLLS